MHELSLWIERLGTGDASEVRMVTGQPAVARTRTGVEPFGDHALTAGRIAAALTGVGLAHVIPRKDAPDAEHEEDVEGIPCTVKVSRRGSMLKVTIKARGAPKPAPLRAAARPERPRGGIVERVRNPVTRESPGERRGGSTPTPTPSPSPSPNVTPTPAPPRPAPPDRRATPDPIRSDDGFAQTRRFDGPNPATTARLEPAAPPDAGPSLELEGRQTMAGRPPPGAEIPGVPRAAADEASIELDLESGPLELELGGSAPLELTLDDSVSLALDDGISLADVEAGTSGPPGLALPDFETRKDGPEPVEPVAPVEATEPEAAVGVDPQRAAAGHPERPGSAIPSRDAPPGHIELGGERSADPALTSLLRRARKAGASDVHLSAGEPPRGRVTGMLRPLEDGVTDEVTMAQWVDALVTSSQRATLNEHGHADFAAQIAGAGRVRVNACRHRRGHKLSLRMIDDAPRTLAELGLPEEVAKITRHHQGLGVVSGPSGHGKTTTLAALVDLINASKPVHIITVEDPVEVLHPIKKAVISQREVGRHTRSFQAALKGALREDPDVIVIGELRDRETVEMALSAAETGHLVLATMSTPNGSRTIDRLIDLFPPEDQAQVRTTLAGALKMVISQRLVPSADGRRRHAAAEMITGNIPLWALIRDDKLFQLPSLLQRGRGYGMISVEASLRELLDAGHIDRETAQTWADDPRSFAPEPEPEPESAETSGVFDRGRFGRRRR